MFDILIVLSIRKGYNIILLKKIAVKMVSFGVKSRFRANLFASTVSRTSISRFEVRSLGVFEGFRA